MKVLTMVTGLSAIPQAPMTTTQSLDLVDIRSDVDMLKTVFIDGKPELGVSQVAHDALLHFISRTVLRLFEGMDFEVLLAGGHIHSIYMKLEMAIQSRKGYYNLVMTDTERKALLFLFNSALSVIERRESEGRLLVRVGW